MADIIDIVTRLSYEAQTAPVQKAIDDFNKLSTSIDKTKQKLAELQEYQKNAQNAQQSNAAAKSIEQTTALLEKQSIAYQKKAKIISEAVNEEIGRVTQLRQVIVQLEKEQATLTDPAKIKQYTRDIATVKAQLADLLAPPPARSLGLIEQLQNRLKIVQGTIPTLQQPLDISRANREASSIRTQIDNLNKLGQAAKPVPGIIQQINNEISTLNKQRILARSEDDIKRINLQIQALQGRLSTLNRAGLQQDPKSNGALSQIGQSLLMGVGIGTGYGILSRGISEIYGLVQESAELARQIEGVQSAFNRLNDPNLLSNLREATKGTLSDLQLMQKAVEFRNFGLPVQRLGELLDFARVRARETGLSIDYITNSLVSGIARNSPRILDNLGLSQVKIREEFKRIGNFAEAAFNIINEEAKRANQELFTTQDRLDQITATLQNAQATFGQGLNYLKLVGIDFLSATFEFGKTLVGLPDEFKSLSEEYRNAQKAINQEIADAPLVANQANALFLSNFRQFTDQYKTADYDSRRTIEKQAEEMYAQLLATAQQWQAEGRKLDDTYFAGLRQAFQQTQTFFKANGVNIDNVKAGDIRKLSGEQINDLQTQIGRRRDLLSREDQKDEEQLRKLQKLGEELAAEEAIRTGKTDAKSIKAGETLAEKRLKLEADLQKRIADLRDEYNQTYIKGEQSTISTIVDGIASKYVKAIDQLEIRYNEAKRKGLITPAVESLFQQERGLETSIFENQVDTANLNENIRVQKAAADLREKALQDEIRIFEQREKIRGFDFSDAVSKAQKQTQLEILEANKRYDTQAEMAKGNAEALADIAKNQQEGIKLIEEAGLRAQLDVYTQFLDDILSRTENAYGAILRAINADANREIGALQEQLLSGEISYRQYVRRSGRVGDNAAINEAGGNIARTNDQIAQAQSVRQSLQLQAQAGIDVTAQLQANQQKLDELQSELNKFREDLISAEQNVTNKRADNFQNQVGILSDLVSATAQAYNQINAIQQQSLDREINVRQDRVRQAERLADRGNTEALRREEQYLRESQRQREQAARRQIAINAALTSSQAILGVVSAASTGDPYTIIPRAIAAIAAITGGILAVSAASRNATATLPAFAQGVVGFKGTGTGTSDSNIVRISHGESVITEHGTSQYPNLLEAVNKRYDPIPALYKDMGLGSMRSDSVSRKEFRELAGKMDILTEAVIDSKVGVTANINENGIYVATERVGRAEQRRWNG